jgi:hypothetical protein
MANTDNTCSNLEIVDHYVEGTDTLNQIVEIQADNQKNVYGYDFDSMSLRDLMTFWHMNNHSLIDEIHEATDALGGVKDGSGSAIWKRWKKDFAKFDTMKFSDLSASDQLECKFEIIDMLHFFMNYAISVGMDGREMYNMYMAKNAENRARQKRGY